MLALAAAVAGCAGETISTPASGKVLIDARSSELSVGDTMTLNPGVQYNDGRWVPLTDVKLTVLPDTTRAAIDSATRLMRAKQPGTVTVRLDIPQVGFVTRDFAILP
jgi:hypothetical protein